LDLYCTGLIDGSAITPPPATDWRSPFDASWMAGGDREARPLVRRTSGGNALSGGSLHDLDAYGVPALYWCRTVRNPKAPGRAEFVPELIHNRSGVGSSVWATDLNRDGTLDIVTATDRGLLIF